MGLKNTLLFIIALLFVFTGVSFSQNTVAPFKTSQSNTDFYVNMGAGTYHTIQQTVTAACAFSLSSTVVILPGSNPSDTIAAVTGGCTKTNIYDRRTLPFACYSWSGSVYTSTGCSSGSGGTPAGVNTDLQINESGSFAADSGNLQNNSTTHDLFQKQINYIPYTSQYQTGGGNNGTGNLYTSPNIYGVRTAGDGTDIVFPTQNGSYLQDVNPNNGTFGMYYANCNVLPGANPQYVTSTGQFNCYTETEIETLAAPYGLNGVGPWVHAFNSYCEYTDSYSVGNPNYFPGGSTGWTGCNGVEVSSQVYSNSISNSLSIIYTKNAADDHTGISVIGNISGPCRASSDQCHTGEYLLVGETPNWPTSTIVSTTGAGDTHLTLATPTGFPNWSSGNVLIDTASSVTGNIVSSTHFVTTGVLNLFHTADGSGMTPSVNYTMTSISASSGGTATITGSFSGCGLNACATGELAAFVQGGNPYIQQAFPILASTTTTLTVRAYSVGAQTFTSQVQLWWHVTCTGGGGSGGGGWAWVESDGKVHLNPDESSIQSGSGYTGTPTCTVDSAAGGTPATFSPVFTAPFYTFTLSGTPLTPSTNYCILQSTIPKSAVSNVNQTDSVICANQLGSAMPAGPAWAITDATPEFVNLSSPSGSGLTQSFGMSHHLPHLNGSIIVSAVAGTHGYACFDANAAGNAAVLAWPFCFPWYGSIANNQGLYGVVIDGTQNNAQLPFSGAMLATFSSPNNGIHIYRNAAEILYTTPDSFGTNPFLNFNDATWANGDPVFQPPTNAYYFSGLGVYENANTPTSGAGGNVIIAEVGGQAAVKGVDPIQIVNSANPGQYLECDLSASNISVGCVTQLTPNLAGTYTPMTAIEIQGGFGSWLEGSAVISNTGALLQVHDSPSSSYGLFSGDGGAGSIGIDNPNTSIDFSQNIRVGNMGLFGGTIQSGNEVIAETTVKGQSLLLVQNFSTSGLQLVNSDTFMALGYNAVAGSVISGAQNGTLGLGEVAAGQYVVGTPPPTNPNIFFGGATGSTLYTYYFTCSTGVGENQVYATTFTNSGPAVLNGTNYIIPKALLGPACQFLKIYRGANSGGYNQGLIGTAPLNAQDIQDTGQTATGSLPDNVTDNSFSLYMDVPNGCATWSSHLLGSTGVGCSAIFTGTVTLTTATSDVATVTGAIGSSVCIFSPTNATASASTVGAYISAVGTNSVTISHVATSASGGTMNIYCK